MSLQMHLEVEGNTLRVVGGIGLMTFRRILAGINSITMKKGYEDVVLDLSACNAAFAGPMLALCTSVQTWRQKGVDFVLRPPTLSKMGTLFRNTNWANILDPLRFPPSTFRGYTHVPAINFSTDTEQFSAVNQMIDATLSSMEALDREDLHAIEWALSEVTDNVLVHAKSEIGGYVQLSNHSRRRRVEFVVADAGIGIPASLREGHPDLRYDYDALEIAIREGVTRDLSVGQGNGLFGTFQATRASQGGYFHLHSGYARLDHEADQLRLRSETTSYEGSLVVACMDCSNPSALGEALRFKGEKHNTWGYVDMHYEPDVVNDIVLILKDEARSFGSRAAGYPVRVKIKNLIHMRPEARIIVDMNGIPMMSSSFADEVFGKLFVELGSDAFVRVVQWRNVTEIVRALIDRAVVQRSHTGL